MIMPLKLMYITNNPEVATIVEQGHLLLRGS